MKKNTDKLFFALKFASAKVVRFFISRGFVKHGFSRKTLKHLLYIVPLGIVLPLGFASAGPFDTLARIGDIFLGIFIGVIPLKIILSLFVMVFAFIPPMLGAIVLNAVLGDNIIGLQYTRGGVVDVGWAITRDVSNILIILVLVIIAISTILGDERRGVRTLLPKLIFVAVLINFSKVIVGAVVDIANIITYYFLSPIKNIGNLFVQVFWQSTPMYNAYSQSVNLFKGFSMGNIGELFDLLSNNLSFSSLIGDMISTIVLIFVGFALMIAMFAFALVFIIRYIAIWLLVIVSPLAFVASILPDTKKYYEQWWGKLQKWAFIGVFPSFILFLVAKMLELKNDQTSNAFSSVTQALPVQVGGFTQQALSNTNTLMAEVVFWIVIIIFMFMGLSASLKMNSTMAVKANKWRRQAIGGITGFTKRKFDEKYGDRIAGGVRNVGDRAGNRLPGVFGSLARQTSRNVADNIRKRARENFDRQKRSAQNIQGKDPVYDDLAFAIKKGESPAKRMALISRALDLSQGDYNDFQNQLTNRGLTAADIENEYKNIGKQASLRGEEMPFLKSRPDLYGDIRGTTAGKEDLLKTISNDGWRNMPDTVFNDPVVREEFYKSSSINGSAMGKIQTGNISANSAGTVLKNPSLTPTKINELMNTGSPAINTWNSAFKDYIDSQLPAGTANRQARVSWLTSHGRQDLAIFLRQTDLPGGGKWLE